MGKLTIREIAKMAGVSPTAVSFVINNKDGISEETRTKIIDVIERTGFKPSVNSRRLFFRKSYNISLVIKQTSSPFSDLFYFRLQRACWKRARSLATISYSPIYPKAAATFFPYSNLEGFPNPMLLLLSIKTWT